MKNLYICLGIAICSWVFFDIWWAISPGLWSWQAIPTLLSSGITGLLLGEIFYRKKLRRIRKE